MNFLLLLLLLPFQEGSPEELETFLAPIREEFQVPALGAAVVRGKGLEAIGVVGVRKAGDEIPVTLKDLWHLGSCTKSMTATLIATLVERNKLGWETTVGEIFGEEKAEIHPDLRAATVRDLLSHRSGLREDRKPDKEEMKFFGRQGSAAEQRARMVKGTLKRGPTSPRGEHFQYSNLGYVLAGAMAERVTGKSWESLMKEEVFAKLGMKSSGFGPPGSQTEIDQPRGHVFRDPKFVGMNPVPFADNPAGMAPAGTVHCSLEDWAKYVALHLRGARQDTSLLKQQSFAILHQPREGEDYAGGWAEKDRPWGGGKVLIHDGTNGLWYALAVLAPQKDFAILVTSNAGPSKGSEACSKAAQQLIERMTEKN